MNWWRRSEDQACQRGSEGSRPKSLVQTAQRCYRAGALPSRQLELRQMRRLSKRPRPPAGGDWNTELQKNWGCTNPLNRRGGVGNHAGMV